MSLEEIGNSGLPTGNIRIPFKGWETQRPQRIHIRGYDFQLAKKIIAYLRNLEKREDILSVLLLGDAALIPPSYYFHVPYLKKINVEDKPYNEWIVLHRMRHESIISSHMAVVMGLKLTGIISILSRLLRCPIKMACHWLFHHPAWMEGLTMI